MRQTTSQTVFVLVFSIFTLLSACGSDQSTNSVPATTEPIARSVLEPAEEEVAPSTTLQSAEAPVAFNGREVPIAPTSAREAVDMFIDVETQILTDGLGDAAYADLGHQEQLIVRTLGRNPEWQEEFLAGLPDDLRAIAELHLLARAELGMLHSGGSPITSLPAWQIIEPAPMAQLVRHYEAANEATGIDWEVLAGINLIETGMGRIDGLSTAGAQGPMQFLPTTWEEVSEGGDIENPADAIAGAARYLVRRGGDEDIRAGLWGYNNSDHYVNAVLAYRDLLRLEPRLLRGFYNWEIYVGTDVGTLWLPVGLTTDGNQAAAAYLAENPWAKTLP